MIIKSNLPSLFRSLDRDEFLTPFDNIFDSFLSSNYPNFQNEFGIDFFGKGAYPKVDVYDQDKSLSIIAEIPGLTKDEITLEVDNGIFSISGEKHTHPITKENYKCIRKELKYSAFKRSFKLGDNLDPDSIKAKFNNGILEIIFDKIQVETPTKKTIEIE